MDEVFNQKKILNTNIKIISFFTAISLLLAIFRDKIFSIFIGSGPELDIYYTAFKIPDLIFLLIATTFGPFVLIPYLKKIKESGKNIEESLAKIFSLFFLIIFFVSALVYFLLPYFLNYFFPDFVGENYKNLLNLTRFFLLSPILIGLGNIFLSLNNFSEKFFVSSITGILYNLSIIFSVFIFFPFFGVYGLGLGVVLGAFFYFLASFFSVNKKQIKIFFLFLKNSATSIKKEEFLYFFKKGIPRSLSVFVYSLGVFLIFSKISRLGSGSVTIFSFASGLFAVPVSVFSGAFSSAIFPRLSENFIKNKIDKFRENIKKILNQILFFTLPTSAVFFLLSHEISSIIFASNLYGPEEVYKTSILLKIFSVAIIFQSLIIFITRAIYSTGKNLIVFLLSFLFFLFILISYFFIKEGDLFFWTALYSFSIILISLLFYFIFKKVFFKNFKLLDKNSFKIIGANILTFIFIYFLKFSFLKNIQNFILENIFLNFIFFGFLFSIFLLVVLIFLKEENILSYKNFVFNFFKKQT